MSLLKKRADDAPPFVEFHKYSSHGNHFVIVDELSSTPLTEAAKSEFARRATDPYSGIGADNTIFVQPYSLSVMREINVERGYWREHPTLDKPPQAIVRFFEPNGAEFMTCGNALMCVARHLYHLHALATLDVLVEVPSRSPRACTIGYSGAAANSVVNICPDTARLPEFVAGRFPGSYVGDALYFHGLDIDIGGVQPIVVSGLIVYSGEPHMVLFQLPDMRKPPGWPAALPWEMRCPDLFAVSLDALGQYLNHRTADLFPHGINVTVARPLAPGTFEFRCFERGIYRETMACGTGALAVTMAAHHLDISRGPRTCLLPHLGRQHARYRDAQIAVEREGTSYSLTSISDYVFSGTMPSSPGGRP